MELNEFSEIIQSVWTEKFSDSPITVGAMKSLAIGTKYDVDYCIKLIQSQTENIGFTKFVTIAKRNYANNHYFDTQTGMYHKIYTDQNGRQFYYVPVIKEYNFVLNPAFRITPGDSKDKIAEKLISQFDYLFKSGQIGEKEYEYAQKGIKILTSKDDVNDNDSKLKHFNDEYKYNTEEYDKDDDIPF